MKAELLHSNNIMWWKILPQQVISSESHQLIPGWPLPCRSPTSLCMPSTEPFPQCSSCKHIYPVLIFCPHAGDSCVWEEESHIEVSRRC